jgi:hypothetical protein
VWLLVALLLVAAVAVGGLRLVALIRDEVRAQPRFRAVFRNTQVTPLPPWIECDLLAQVQDVAGLPDTLQTLDADLAERLRDAFARNPWVREVEEVRIVHPATIRVKLEYREPVAVVRSVRGAEPVDRDAVLLPIGELRHPEVYLTVTGVRSTPTGPAGTHWDDAAVAAAAVTAHALAPRHRTLGLTTLDVSSYHPTGDKPGHLYLLTEQGTRVKWGHPPDSDYPGEVPTDDKIDRLLEYVQLHGSLDAPRGPYDIDVTHWQEITIRSRGQTSERVR